MNIIKETLRTIIVVAILVAGVSIVSAWTGPTQSAPNGNTPEPINTSGTSQIKSGAFQVNGFRNLGSSIFDGNVGIGTTAPSGADAFDRVLEISSAGLARPNIRLHRPGFVEYKIAIEDVNNSLYIVNSTGNALPRSGAGIVMTSTGKVSATGDICTGVTGTEKCLSTVLGSTPIGTYNCTWTAQSRSPGCPAHQYVNAVAFGSTADANTLIMKLYCCTPQ